MNTKQLILLGQLKEALQNKQPNMANHCIGLINRLVDLETEQSDRGETEKREYGIKSN